jgi:hypothetical protein
MGCARDILSGLAADAPSTGSLRLAKTPAYDFEKRRKEQERKAKKDAKREEKLRRKREGQAEDGAEPGEAIDPTV